MNASAQLDNRNRAREDEDMDNANDTLRSEISNGFRALPSCELHRRDMQEGCGRLDDKIDRFRESVDVRFRWLAGLMLTCILGTVGIVIKLM
jgi:hypothetical protein